ncbi:MAG: SDR family NAD(P)-dependent oxidoreductase [Deltaproteobacteria bacterium]|jgi:NADP-dependent 3-hydroxy acid dehydrogenase YdfG/acyl carrier protein|nr:SDR family NAD(P)-dependent oxidoreductase [Deltaproteobacteria bacterium]MBW2534610.1 SDR family NAD(P)-dependent oxidoreductase [Deltaproteobacteria bacterium]
MGQDPVIQQVLAVVSEKTGYPPDMLDLELDVEADLGIDTVKQAEMFAAIREAWGVARDDTIQLRDFPTIGHVVRFVLDRAPEASPETGTSEAGARSEPSPDDEVEAEVLAIIADKTGYPVDMLELDLDLEADLGIDTVKQAEMFAAIREAYGGARDESFQLRDFPTIGHVVRFAVRHRAEAGTSVAAGDEPAAPDAPTLDAAPTSPAIAGDLQAAAALARRVPTPVLRPPLELCKATGVRLSTGSRVVVMCDAEGAGDELCTLLEARGVEVHRLEASLDAAVLSAAIDRWQSDEPLHGIYWLAGLDEAGDISNLSLDDWRRALEHRAKGLYTALRAALPSMSDRAGSFLVAATALGGFHGYDDAGATRPLGGAVAGLCKAFSREQPGALVKVVDFDPKEAVTAMAERLVAETIADPGVVEVGYGRAGHGGASERWTVGLAEQGYHEANAPLELLQDTVFVVTGAAGSIVAAIVADLAKASGGTFYLLDLCAEPDRSNPDLKRLDGDRAELKRELFERLQQTGERVTPALVEREIAKLERDHAALGAIEAIRSAGGTAHYRAVDLLDAQAVEAVIAEVRARHPRVDVLLHGAGLEISHPLAHKEPEEFARVFDVKADGWFNLMKALADVPLGAVVAFSSIAGRFGNAGQTDYSAANDLLCKLCSSLRCTRPETRALAIDWTAWRDIGMASRGSIPLVMERAGIDMLAPEAGIVIIRRELRSADAPSELVVAGGLGVLLDELDETGGLDARQVAASGTALDLQVLGMGQHEGLAAQCELDPKAPFLADHRIDGVPVLPGVMGIEAFAELCEALVPERAIVAIEQVEFAAPFKLYRDEPRTCELRAAFELDGADVVARCELVGKRVLHGQSEPQTTVHFRGRVRLGTPPDGEGREPLDVPTNGSGAVVGSADVYPDVYFHGPSYQVLHRAWGAAERAVGEMAGELPTDVGVDRRTRTAPRWLELCFQTAGLLDLGTRQRLALPQGLEAVRLWRAPAADDEGMRALVVRRADGLFDATVVDGRGLPVLELEGYRSVELPAAVDPARLSQVKEAFH